MTNTLAQFVPSDITSLGAAGIMGAMWLWERKSNRKREEQLDAAHARIQADRLMLNQFVEVIQQNTKALEMLSVHIEQCPRRDEPR